MHVVKCQMKSTCALVELAIRVILSLGVWLVVAVILSAQKMALARVHIVSVGREAGKDAREETGKEGLHTRRVGGKFLAVACRRTTAKKKARKQAKGTHVAQKHRNTESVNISIYLPLQHHRHH